MIYALILIDSVNLEIYMFDFKKNLEKKIYRVIIKISICLQVSCVLVFIKTIGLGSL